MQRPMPPSVTAAIESYHAARAATRELRDRLERDAGAASIELSARLWVLDRETDRLRWAAVAAFEADVLDA